MQSLRPTVSLLLLVLLCALAAVVDAASAKCSLDPPKNFKLRARNALGKPGGFAALLSVDTEDNVLRIASAKSFASVFNIQPATGYLYLGATVNAATLFANQDDNPDQEVFFFDNRTTIASEGYQAATCKIKKSGELTCVTYPGYDRFYKRAYPETDGRPIVNIGRVGDFEAYRRVRFYAVC